MEPMAAATADEPVLRQAQHERESTPVTLSLSKGDRHRRVVTAHRAWVVLAGLALIGGVTVTVRYFAHSPLSPQSSVLVTQEAPTLALPLPDKPSLVVLPFVNMSKDP